MLTTRIRYVADSNNNLVSKEPLLVAGELLTVTLVPSSLSYVITNSANGQLVTEGNAVSMQMLKITVKKDLRSRGAVFGDEVRNKSLKQKDSQTLMETLSEWTAVIYKKFSPSRLYKKKRGRGFKYSSPN